MFHLRLRSIRADHREVVRLVARCGLESNREVMRYQQRLLDRKNEVEYQDREVTLADSRVLARHAHQLLDIVRTDLEG